MNTYLFDKPLAEQLRPQTIDGYLGQQDVTGINTILRKMILTDDYSSFILWGPPGCGKTTLAHIIKEHTTNRFISLSAVTTGIKEVKDLMKETQDSYGLYHTKTILFIDEIHRFNKAQQDAFLSYVENGSIILIGATTENPSFSVISPLLSRMRVFILKQLKQEDLSSIMNNALSTIEKDTGKTVSIHTREIQAIIALSGGDARRALGILELAVKLSYEASNDTIHIERAAIEKVLQGRMSSYDKSGDYHYDYLSALHKSMRNSDPDAALYYAVLMLDAGEDPMNIMRRVIQCAAEDIGLADPQALILSTASRDALQSMGMPEAMLPILEAVTYNALAPKSNSLYTALQAIRNDIKTHPDAVIPLHLRNAVTGLMKEAGYGSSYQYAHDYDIPVTQMQCLPDVLKDRTYYLPKKFGFEKELSKRLEALRQIQKGSGNDV